MSTTDGFRRRGISTLCCCFVLVAAGCSCPPAPITEPSQTGTTTATAAPGSAALKRIDSAAFEASVEAAAKALLVPGAVVVLRTPQGNFTAAAGATQLGAWVIWTNLTVSPDGKPTANALLPIVLDEIYAGLSLSADPAPTTTR